MVWRCCYKSHDTGWWLFGALVINILLVMDIYMWFVPCRSRNFHHDDYVTSISSVICSGLCCRSDVVCMCDDWKHLYMHIWLVSLNYQWLLHICQFRPNCAGSVSCGYPLYRCLILVLMPGLTLCGVSND